MAYSALTDLEEQLSSAELIELTDDAGSGSVDTDVIDRSIADADAEIDAYCNTRYATPFTTVPVMIRKVSVDIAIYNLYSRRQIVTPENRKDRYDKAMAFLKDVTNGIATLGSDAPSQSTLAGPEATTVKSDRVFTRGLDSDSSTGTLDNY